MKVNIGKYGKDRRVQVKIEPWDTWSADHTLALIIYPLLKQMRKKKQGAPHVDDSDVPESLHSTKSAPKKNEWDTDEYWFERWNWVLKEMTWTFKQLKRTNAKNFWIVEPELDLTKQPEDQGKKTIPVRWRVEGEYDEAAAIVYDTRIQNGLRLFGKYYRSLWT